MRLLYALNLVFLRGFAHGQAQLWTRCIRAGPIVSVVVLAAPKVAHGVDWLVDLPPNGLLFGFPLLFILLGLLNLILLLLYFVARVSILFSSLSLEDLHLLFDLVSTRAVALPVQLRQRAIQEGYDGLGPLVAVAEEVAVVGVDQLVMCLLQDGLVIDGNELGQVLGI